MSVDTNCNNNIEIKYNLVKENSIEKIKNIYILLKNVEISDTYVNEIKSLIQKKNLNDTIELVRFENNELTFDLKFNALTSSDGNKYDGTILNLSNYSINNDDIFRLLYEVWKNEIKGMLGGKNNGKKNTKRYYKKNKTISKKYIVI